MSSPDIGLSREILLFLFTNDDGAHDVEAAAKHDLKPRFDKMT